MASPSGKRLLTDWNAFQADVRQRRDDLRAGYARCFAGFAFAAAELITKQLRLLLRITQTQLDAPGYF
jgi:hypothetical protein